MCVSVKEVFDFVEFVQEYINLYRACVYIKYDGVCYKLYVFVLTLQSCINAANIHRNKNLSEAIMNVHISLIYVKKNAR